MKIFWDTNVLVDLLLVRRPFYEAASTILSISEDNDWQIIVSSLSVMNANYMVHPTFRVMRQSCSAYSL
ncbi:MAG: hypothetical protein ACI30I_03730, partial [Parabacteroides sp.]